LNSKLLIAAPLVNSLEASLIPVAWQDGRESTGVGYLILQ
jgi:hypothetical protein